MRKTNQQTIGEALSLFLKENGLDVKMHRASVINNWEEIMGKMLYKHTKSLYFSENKCFLELDSPALKQEVFMQRENIIKKINEFCAFQLVDELVLK